MNFFDKITGNDMKKQDQEFQKKIDQMPVDYQTAWREINQKLWNYTDFSGRNLYPILNGVLGLFEESAQVGLPINAVVGDDLDEFVRDLTQAEGAKDYYGRLHDRLNKRIMKKLGREE